MGNKLIIAVMKNHHVNKHEAKRMIRSNSIREPEKELAAYAWVKGIEEMLERRRKERRAKA